MKREDPNPAGSTEEFEMIYPSKLRMLREAYHKEGHILKDSLIKKIQQNLKSCLEKIPAIRKFESFVKALENQQKS